MENIPDKLKAEPLEFFEKHKDKLEGVDHVINEMRKPFNPDPHRAKTVKHWVDYYDNTGVVKLQDFDPELSDWIQSNGEQ